MKKIILSLVLFFAVAVTSNAQVLFGTAQTLKSGGWSLGINPVVATEGNDNFALFFHGGYGLGRGSDLGLKLGFGWGNEAYVGLDYEKTVLAGKPSVSLAGGAHYFRYFGLDFTPIVTFPISNVRITTGLDMDLVFGEDAAGEFEMWFPMWLPISLEVYIKKHFSIVFEGNVELTDRAWTTVGGGINIYF